MRSAHIQFDSAKGLVGRLVVDDIDLSDMTTGLTLTLQAGELPVLAVDLVTLPVEVDGEARLLVADATRTALIAFGWTPPAD
jgi:hypothetical protein